MMKRLAYLITSISITVFGTVLVMAPPASAACPDAYVFGIPAWYNHLGGGGGGEDGGSGGGAGCKIDLGKKPNVAKITTIIALNVVQALMVITAYVAIFFIIKGGLNYIYGAGSPDSIQSAKQTIQNAVIGMIIAAMAAGIINAIAGAIE